MTLSRTILFALSLALVVSCGKERSSDPGNGQPREYTLRHCDAEVNIENLLREMTDRTQDAFFPSPYYETRMVSSTDARSVSPDRPYWFANTDNSRYVRIENNKKVIFEEDGPGVITRIWTVGMVGESMCVYIDGEQNPRIVFANCDPSTANWKPESPLAFRHPWYEKYSGANLYYPIPFSRSAKIVVETVSTNHAAYHISYRKYEEGTKMKSFTVSDARSLKSLASETAETLSSHPSYTGGVKVENTAVVSPGDTVSLELPKGECAVRDLSIRVGKYDASQRESLLRNLYVRMVFDGFQTVWAPLADFSGTGNLSMPVDSWYLTANGNGRCECRFIMPYSRTGLIQIVNLDKNSDPKVMLSAQVDDKFEWHTNSMYFHADFHSADRLRMSNDYLGSDVVEWCNADLTGSGVYKGDILSVLCHDNTWYGEGDEKVWIDDDTFPSFFGTGTEDYYNTSFAPVVQFQNAFGGNLYTEANRRDIWLRTRNLDGMTFKKSLKFNWEIESWAPGTVDYASVIWWYGCGESKDHINQK